MRLRTEPTRRCKGCTERRIHYKPLPLFCEPCRNLETGTCDVCGENDGHTNIRRHQSCQDWLESEHERLSVRMWLEDLEAGII